MLIRRLCLLLPLLSSACLLAPGDGDVVSDRSETIHFQGSTPSSGDVQIEASPTPGGPYTAWEGSGGSPSPRPITWEGEEYYLFSLHRVVPESLWGSSEIIPGCFARQTHIRVRQGSFSLMSFPTPAGSQALICMNNYPDVVDGLLACRSANAPEARVRERIVHHGDVEILNSDDLERARCFEIIEGELRIPDSSLMTVELPLLREVSGTLSIHYRTEPGATSNTVRHVEAPLLRSVGGDLELRQNNSGLSIPVVTPLGLNALQRVSGDLSFHSEQFYAPPTGLNQLGEVGGDLHVELGPGDGAFALPVLRRVGGDLELAGGNNNANVLRTVTEVAGDVTLRSDHDGQWRSTLDGLENVGGRLSLSHYGPVFPDLLSVGALHLQGVDSLGLAGPDYNTQVGALDLSGVNALPERWRLAIDAPVSATRDGGLSLAELCSFLCPQPDYAFDPAPRLDGSPVLCACP